MGAITRLWKNGVSLEIKIVGSEELDITDNFKTVVHQAIGNKDFYEFVNKGDQKIVLPLYLASKDDYDDLIDFLSDGKSFSLESGDISAIFSLDGGLKSTRSHLDGSYLTTLTLTSATDPDFKGILEIGGIAETPFSKPSTLDTIRSWANKTIDFVSNTNGAIAGFTGKFEEYSVAITQLTGGIASSSTIITSPINSIRNSASSIIGGVAGIVSSIGTAINAIKQVPTQVQDLIDSILDIGDQFSNIFNLDNKADQVKATTNFLIDVGIALIEVDKQPLSGKVITEDPYSVSYDMEIIISSDDKNIEILSVLILSSILLSIYEQSSQITRWNKTDLDNLLKQTETLFSYIMAKNIDTETRNKLNLARNSFYRSFRALYDNASNIITINVDNPTFLSDVVYSVNGNFDYYSETKKLNNIIGSVVQGEIQVISND